MRVSSPWLLGLHYVNDRAAGHWGGGGGSWEKICKKQSHSTTLEVKTNQRVTTCRNSSAKNSSCLGFWRHPGKSSFFCIHQNPMHLFLPKSPPSACPSQLRMILTFPTQS